MRLVPGWLIVTLQSFILAQVGMLWGKLCSCIHLSQALGVLQFLSRFPQGRPRSFTVMNFDCYSCTDIV